MKFFDAKKTAREAGITPKQYAKLARLIRKEFPRNKMLYELHLLRACMAVKDGHVRIDDALKEDVEPG